MHRRNLKAIHKVLFSKLDGEKMGLFIVTLFDAYLLFPLKVYIYITHLYDMYLHILDTYTYYCVGFFFKCFILLMRNLM